MAHRRPLQSVLLAALALQFIVGGAIAVRSVVDPQSDHIEPSSVEPAALPLSVESGYRAAESVARSWAGDAKLVAVSMQVDWPLSVDPTVPISVAPGGWIAYTFARPGTSENEIKQTLSLFYERTSGALVQNRIVDWPRSQNAPMLQPLELPVSSMSALTTVEVRTGRAWRAACPVDRHLSRLSLTATTAAPVWIITYADARTDRPGLVARIDAVTGEIIEVDDRSEPCNQG